MYGSLLYNQIVTNPEGTDPSSPDAIFSFHFLNIARERILWQLLNNRQKTGRFFAGNS